MTPTPVVSIIIPTYNRAELISETILSVLASTYPWIQVIVADDGSYDNTEEIVSSFAGNITYTRFDHRGLATTRNQGLSLAEGKYVCFLDSDDTIKPFKFAIQVSALEKKPGLAGVYSKWDYIDINGEYLFQNDGIDFTKDYLSSLALSNFAPIHTYLFCRDWLERVGGFTVELKGYGYEDWDLLLSLAGAGACFGLIPISTVSYRMHSSNMCIVSAKEMCACGLDVIRRFELTDVAREIPSSTIQTAKGLIYIEASCQLFRRGFYEEAKEYFIQAVRQTRHLLINQLFFNYMIAYLSPPEVGQAANAVYADMASAKIMSMYEHILDDWLPDEMKTDQFSQREFMTAELNKWLISREQYR